jgi:hypothetical protein
MDSDNQQDFYQGNSLENKAEGDTLKQLLFNPSLGELNFFTIKSFTYMSEIKNKHLSCVLKSHNIENDEDLMEAYRSKRDQVRTDLEERYDGKIYRILHSGSYKKKTAVNIKFDMDLVVPFDKGEVDTLKELYDDLYSYFDKEYRQQDNSLFEVKKQKVAVGLKFSVDDHTLDLDIVPGREINDYEKDNELNLYVNEQAGSLKGGTTLKTNIQKQIAHIRDNEEARTPIKLLKVWKRTNNIEIKSFVIELITVKAMEDYSGANDTWSILEHVLTFIKNNITSIRLADPGNSNNVVSDAMEKYQKENIVESIKWMLKSIGDNETQIKQYFPVNSDYPCEDKKQTSYKVGAAAGAERLNTNDFGNC